MKNCIRSLPCGSEASTPKSSQKNRKSFVLTPPVSPTNYAPFEFTTFSSIKYSNLRPFLSLSPRNDIQILDNVIDELGTIRTSDIRKNIIITKKDLVSKVSELRSITRLDLDELMEIKLNRWKQKRFIKVDEKEIRKMIKKNTKSVKNLF